MSDDKEPSPEEEQTQDDLPGESQSSRFLVGAPAFVTLVASEFLRVEKGRAEQAICETDYG